MANNLSFFTDSSVSDGFSTTSMVNLSAIVGRIQSDSSDSYFDSTSKIDSVYIYYTHQDGRQVKKIIHLPENGLTSSVSWPFECRDGIWEKTKVRVFDHDGAEYTLSRPLIGTGEDTTHISGQMHLNIS